MILTLELAPAREAPRTVTTPVARRLVQPPRFWLLPRPTNPAQGMLASTLLHCTTIAALIWLPVVFPAPVVTNPAKSPDLAQAVEVQPLVLPQLPQLENRGSAAVAHGREASPAAVRHSSRPASAAAEPAAQVPDFIGPQRIVSIVPNAVNRVQTIQRPDLVSPPKLKFPLRLQAQVSLPASAVPVLDAPQPEKPRLAPTPAATAPEEVPVAKVAKATVETRVLTLTPKQSSAIRSKNAPAKAIAPNLRIPVENKSDALKSLVVANAVTVVSDASPVPDAELAGSFVVDPSTDAGTREKSSAARGKSADNTSLNTGEGSPAGNANSGTGSASSGGAPAPVAGNGMGSGTSTAPDSRGNGTGVRIAGKISPDGGTGSGSGFGAGSTGRNSGNGNPTGISISGGVSGHTSGTVASTPMQHSYPMMIISGGNNGGASRDTGVFSRSDTVYSVTIPMAGAGGGSDWTMQYALLNPAQASAGLLVPPFVEKKMGASMPKSQLTADLGPVFVTGIVDENGKVRSLRCLRVQDARAQAAIRALEQWEFLPAQLDGKPVATKVVIGVTVSIVE